MKEKILVLFMVLAVASLVSSPLCEAAPNIAVYGYTDKTYYKPGDVGTLKFWLYNSGTEDLILKNVTLYYPWYSQWGQLGGNETITPSVSTVITPGGNWSDTSSFTLPNDGRISSDSSSININVVTDKITRSFSISMSIANMPYPFFLQDIDKLLTWFMILVVAVVVCTVIIAVTIFFTVRRQRMMWGQGEKPQ